MGMCTATFLVHRSYTSLYFKKQKEDKKELHKNAEVLDV